MVVDTLVCAISSGCSYGRLDGVAVVAEGLALASSRGLAGVEDVERDTARERAHSRGEHRPRSSRRRCRKRLKEFGLKATIAAKNIGYELRCADPDPDGHGVHARFGLLCR